MNRSPIIFLLVALLCLAYPGHAQIRVNYDEPSDSSAAMANNKYDNTVVIYADSRLEPALKRHKDAMYGSIYSTRGYRLQIYSGNDRLKATKLKIDFLRRFPGVHAYMSYIQPQFRVKVGDYKTRQEAEQMYHEVGDLCNPCMIVPDIVVINTFKND